MADILLDLLELNKAKGMPFEDAVHHAAMCYVKAGIPVLPIEPDNKALPKASGINYMSASTKESTIHKWFGPNGKFRGFNIGIGCGTKEGVMALDIDAKPVGGTTGIKELARILASEGPLPPGPRQATPSGGFHYLYLWQDNAVSSSSKVANGIDTRGGTVDRCTGHIVAFPSTVAGRGYAWEEGGLVQPMPGWLSESLGQPWRPKAEEEKQKQEIPAHQINRMLMCIDPDSLSYEEWVKVGMAIKGSVGDDGLEIWDSWSAEGSRRQNNECTVRWKTFKEDGPVGFGTLLFMAKEAGWRPLPGDVTSGNNDAEIEEAVLEFNKHYAIVRVSKSIMIATFTNNRAGEQIGFLAMGAFETLSANRTMQVPTRSGFMTKPMSQIWLASQQRREYNDIGIYPNNDQPDGTLNTWNGWGVTPAKGNCKRFLDHMLNILCSGDEGLFEWLLDWMADAVQDSRNVKGCAVILRGVEGCGKGAWADTFGSLFGSHYTHLIDSERLTSRFNSFMADSIIVFADEVLFPGNRQAANVLKGMVSERRVTRESKGIDSIEVDNLSRIIIASNEEWIIPAGPQSRRWLVLHCSPSVAGNREYFTELFGEINNGGKEAVLDLLLRRKITRDLRLAPETEALKQQRMLSNRHDSTAYFLNEMAIRGFFDSTDAGMKMGDEVGWPKVLMKWELFSEYRTWTKENRVNNYDVLNISLFIAKIKDYGFVESDKTVSVPPIEEMKRLISVKMGVLPAK